MGDALDIAQAHGRHRLGAVQGLNLGLLIHTKYQGMVGIFGFGKLRTGREPRHKWLRAKTTDNGITAIHKLGCSAVQHQVDEKRPFR